MAATGVAAVTAAPGSTGAAAPDDDPAGAPPRACRSASAESRDLSPGDGAATAIGSEDGCAGGDASTFGVAEKAGVGWGAVGSRGVGVATAVAGGVPGVDVGAARVVGSCDVLAVGAVAGVAGVGAVGSVGAIGSVATEGASLRGSSPGIGVGSTGSGGSVFAVSLAVGVTGAADESALDFAAPPSRASGAGSCCHSAVAMTPTSTVAKTAFQGMPLPPLSLRIPSRRFQSGVIGASKMSSSRSSTASRARCWMALRIRQSGATAASGAWSSARRSTGSLNSSGTVALPTNSSFICRPSTPADSAPSPHAIS